MRILILSDRIPPENRGGAGEVAWRLTRGLAQRGHEIRLVAATENRSFEETRNGIHTYHIHSSYPVRWRAWLSLHNPQTIPTLKHIYKSFQPEVVNAHNIHMDLSYASLSLAHRMGIATTFSSHDVMPFAYTKLSHFIDPDYCGVSDPQDYRLPYGANLRQARLRYNPTRNWIIRRILTRHADMRTVPSDELGIVHKINRLPAFQTVHNGITLEDFETTPAEVNALRTRLDLAGRRVILFAGRLTRAKGTVQLLNTLLQVVQQVPELILLVLSATSIEEQIQQEEYSNLAHHHIRSGGWLSGRELATAYHVSDCVVTPSIIFDTFPTVNLEAMAAGKPVLATCYGGSGEAVLDGETGYIINPYNTGDFAEKLTRILTNTELRESMGIAGRKRVEEYFSLARQVHGMEQIYIEAIARHRLDS